MRIGGRMKSYIDACMVLACSLALVSCEVLGENNGEFLQIQLDKLYRFAMFAFKSFLISNFFGTYS